MPKEARLQQTPMKAVVEVAEPWGCGPSLVTGAKVRVKGFTSRASSTDFLGIACQPLYTGRLMVRVLHPEAWQPLALEPDILVVHEEPEVGPPAAKTRR